MKNVPASLCRAARLAGLASVFLLAASAAQATLVNDVNVDLIAPGGIVGDSTPLHFSQLAPLASGIAAGGPGDISGFMLDGERIAFSGDSILLQVAQGADGLATGYLGAGGEHARYVLSNLAIADANIVGFTVHAFDGYVDSGFTGLQSPTAGSDYVHLLSPTSISFDLDDLRFVDRGLGQSNNFADFRIDLITAVVPEPGSFALAVAGLIALLPIARRRQR